MAAELSEIALFDVETTFPGTPTIIEFGVILVCPVKIQELRPPYSTLIRPLDMSVLNSFSDRTNGITLDKIISAPTFADVADTVYGFLHGKIWGGHNVIKFDGPLIKKAFEDIGRPAPEPKAIFDTLPILKKTFGRRARDMKLSSLAAHFGLGEQTHRSLDDARMNLEVLKQCAAVLFIEANLQGTFPLNIWEDSMGGLSLQGNNTVPSPANDEEQGNHPMFSLLTSTTNEEVSNPVAASNEMNTDSLQTPDAPMKGRPVASAPGGRIEDDPFLQPDEVPIDSVEAYVQNFSWGPRIILLHNVVHLQIRCSRLQVRFGVRGKYEDGAGRTKLNFVVDAPPNLCRVLDVCDDRAQKLSENFRSSSEWNCVVLRKPDSVNCPSLRLQTPYELKDRIYQEEPSGFTQKLPFSKFDAEELGIWLKPGAIVDAYISLETYDYKEKAGIRLVTKKLIIYKG